MTNILIWMSSLGSLGLALYWTLRYRDKSFLWTLLALGVLLGVLSAVGIVRPPWQGEPASRGEGRGIVILLLYGAMLAGMLAHYLYLRFERPRNRRTRFDLGNFLAPVLVSPIVFLPLASVFESIQSSPAALDASRLMLFLVAFEN